MKKFTSSNPVNAVTQKIGDNDLMNLFCVFTNSTCLSTDRIR